MMTEIASFIQGYLGDRQVKACLALRPYLKADPRWLAMNWSLWSVLCGLSYS